MTIERLKVKKGEEVTHNGQLWQVAKVLIPARVDKKRRAYVRAFPMHDGQVLYRSERTIGDNWV